MPMTAKFTAAALLLLLCTCASAQMASLGEEAPAFTLLHQPQVLLDRADAEGWVELPEFRTPHSTRFRTPENALMLYNSVQAVNYMGEDGQLSPVDIRPVRTESGFRALAQPVGVEVYLDGSFALLPASTTLGVSGKTLTIDGAAASAVEPLHDRQQIWFNAIVPDVDKVCEFRPGAVKYGYLLQQPPAEGSSDYTIEEFFGLPAGCSVHNLPSEHPLKPAVEIRNAAGEVVTGIHPLICYDSQGASHIGRYEVQSQNGGFTLELRVDRAWLLSEERSYPVLIDPLVTGPTANFPQMNIPSCFFPEFGMDGMDVEIPGGITVTNLNVTSNFFASPFTTSVMGDGRMYFSTECNNTVTYQVTGAVANQPGTAYLEDLNMNNPLLCCREQQCEGYTITINKHVSRTSNGPTCNTQFIYYDPFSLWPFSVFAEGHTPELYGNEMQFTPSTLCMNVCEVNARIFVRYGVPPYTFTHPWSDEVIEWGSAAGCNSGQVNRQLLLDLDDCPTYCDLTPFLSVPPPVVIDGCGVVAFTTNTSYNLNLKPAPNAPPSVSELNVCSGDPIAFSWQPCLEGATVTWSVDGQSASTTTVATSFTHSGSEPLELEFTAIASLDGCESEPETVMVNVYALPEVSFSHEPEEIVMARPIQFTDQSTYNGNDAVAWWWEFGGQGSSDDQNPLHVFTTPGETLICLSVTTVIGCEVTHCETVTIAPAELDLPNIITPNNDGINDRLIIQYIEQFPGNKVTVYNRWGQVVFESENYRNNWRAEEVSDGAYYYTVAVPGRETYRQTLQISR